MTQGGWEGGERVRAGLGSRSWWLPERARFSMYFWTLLVPSFLSLELHVSTMYAAVGKSEMTEECCGRAADAASRTTRCSSFPELISSQ